MKVKARINCQFEIEYEDDSTDIEMAKENIEMGYVQDLINLEADASIQLIKVTGIKEISQ